MLNSLGNNGARSIFHYSLPVADITEAKAFYEDTLGCTEILDGKRAADRSDFDLFGHHLALKQVTGDAASVQREAAGQFYARHFGVFLPWEEWETLVERLEQNGTPYASPPSIQDRGTAEESGSLQLVDPSGNGIEFKAARDLDAWFRQ